MLTHRPLRTPLSMLYFVAALAGCGGQAPPATECVSDGDCTSDVACAAPVCTSGACELRPSDSLCQAGETCNVAIGCQPPAVVDSRVDSGVDAGDAASDASDAATDTSDAATDAAVSWMPEVTVGWVHACTTREGGGVTCWGSGSSLGIGAETGNETMGQAVPLSNIVQLSTAGGHTCALDGDGAVFCWGWNSSYQVGDGTNDFARSPRRALGLGVVEVVRAGPQNTCAVVDRQLLCWGNNEYGQSGDPDTETVTEPRVVTGISGVRDAIMQERGTCAVTDGGLVCFGTGNFGTGEMHTDPAARVEVPLGPFDKVVGGVDHICALTASGDVLCFGANLTGACGIPGLFVVSTPTRVLLTEPATDIFAGLHATCAQTASGMICWGPNDNGQLGSGDRDSDRGRLHVSTELAGSRQVSLGQLSTCAWHESGEVRCLGNNVVGQLGDGTMTSRTTAAPVILDP